MESGLMKKKEKDLFHVIHKVPSGDGPYVRAKHAQLVQKDPETAIVWFWKAINAGDRVDSALKDMAVVMKQLDRAEEAIEAIKSFRGLCPRTSQESLDNVLIDLYKKCGKVEEQIVLLKHKLKQIYLGEAFNGKPTKTAVSWKEVSGFDQTGNVKNTQVVYRKAQMIDPDANKALNLCHCLIKQARYDEAGMVLDDVLQHKLPGSNDYKSRNRAEELSLELEAKRPGNSSLLTDLPGLSFEDDFVEALERVMNEWAPTRSRRLPIFEEISQFRDQLAC
ncbi:UNVERIFIED_CONTAM: protein SULFUR DEFICIENCY-INDUCED 1 [Sesamum radiatum]|uniref:Protein SULFUR DEFICIENCY-INDUCED 1 n=1 Tax=Sesamum radiatum TaxID=300843 RepID=A0AAW2UWY4_SESRA